MQKICNVPTFYPIRVHTSLNLISQILHWNLLSENGILGVYGIFIDNTLGLYKNYDYLHQIYNRFNHISIYATWINLLHATNFYSLLIMLCELKINVNYFLFTSKSSCSTHVCVAAYYNMFKMSHVSVQFDITLHSEVHRFADFKYLYKENLWFKE